VALSAAKEGTGCTLAAPSSAATELTAFRVSTDGSLVWSPRRFVTCPDEVAVNVELPLPVRVRKLVHLSDCHPAQWAGRTETGDFIYVRFRYGRLWIGIAPDYRRTPPTTVLETGYGDLDDGYLSFHSLRMRTKGVIEWPKRTRRLGLTL
jgi:hypothetical protein